MDSYILKGQQIINLIGDGELIVIQGCLWITFENDCKDYVLKAGDRMYFANEQCGIAEALSTTEIKIQKQIKVLPEIEKSMAC